MVARREGRNIMTIDNRTSTQPRSWASATDAAKHAGISRKTVDRMCAAGKLTRYKLGGRVLVDLDELDALILATGFRNR